MNSFHFRIVIRLTIALMIFLKMIILVLFSSERTFMEPQVCLLKLLQSCIFLLGVCMCRCDNWCSLSGRHPSGIVHYSPIDVTLYRWPI